jgi:hypothetical protein
MPTTITQSYASEKQAREAAAALRKTFRDDLVKVEKRYTGNATVTVQADSDKAIAALRILNEPDAAPNAKPSRLRDDPAPLSRFLHLPVLSNRKPRVTLFKEPAPLSRLLGLPTIISDTSDRRI